MMNFKKYLVIFVVVLAVIALVGAVDARVGVGTRDLRERVIAHTEGEVSQALSHGCSVVREAKTLTALRCPGNVAESLSLSEDVKVFALDEENPVHSLGYSKVGTASVSANRQIGADIVQAAGNTGSGRKIVVLDTGYNYNHPDLSSSYLGGKDFVNSDNDPMDDNGHGSHVSGIITADGIDNLSDKGVAPDAKIIAGKVLDKNGSGYFSDVVAGIYWAVDGTDGIYGTLDDFGADAINLSLGTSAPYMYRNSCDKILPDLTNAISYAKSKGVLVVAAAGNSGKAGVSIPGCISYSTTVGAVDSADKVASFSGRGNTLDLTAPGVNILSTVLNNGYATWSGTSMATPMVSGVIALIKAAHPSYGSTTVETAMFSTAKDLGSRGKDNDYGYGRIQANKAVNY